MSVDEIIYKSKDNKIDLLLMADNDGSGVPVAQDLTSVTRMVITDSGGTLTIDSAINSECFDWDNGVTGRLILTLGGLSVDLKKYRCRLVVYDAVNTNGIVWVDSSDFSITFKN